MPTIHPFRAVRYSDRFDLSGVVAPPYDVLDSASKQRLLSKDSGNIVAIDLPHTPAKELGPPGAYESAAAAYRSLLHRGVLTHAKRPAIFAYRQTFKSEDGERTVQRSGMACCIEIVPFGPRPGGGILPHEETFSGPKEDRFALMKATRAQLSPIFGLHADESGKATSMLVRLSASRSPDNIARTDDGTLHEVWTVDDETTIRAYQDALATEDIFVADGHHRYNTALNYLRLLESQGPVPPDHPARRCMFVLVGMSDPGLVIWPTHRILGGMQGYSFDAFLATAGGRLRIEPVSGSIRDLDAALQRADLMGPRRFGLFDFATRRMALAIPSEEDPLAQRFPEKPRAWRDLVVAYIQYVLVEEICQARLNCGQPVKWAFPHTIPEVEEIGSGTETGAGGGKTFGETGAQLAVIVRPTPLQAVKDVSRANQLMPQKSTFFFPKLATGLFINPLE